MLSMITATLTRIKISHHVWMSPLVVDLLSATSEEPEVEDLEASDFCKLSEDGPSEEDEVFDVLVNLSSGVSVDPPLDEPSAVTSSVPESSSSSIFQIESPFPMDEEFVEGAFVDFGGNSHLFPL
ncbi:unnamed protein product [Peronospora destructor]|uniref:Uncharacterized protein n=1 Tax=Peronospora destructor TaxID=86335 RepID=A0AAV0VEY2_9STRA|nr:unnamed protein product [Peronospora destructor]